MGKEIQVKDKNTGQVFKLRASESTTFVTTRDGVRVRLHPIVIKTFIRKGDTCAGHTILGEREMVRL
jgi:hypothetical protein